MSITIETKLDKTAIIRAGIQDATKQAIAKVCIDTESKAKNLAPVDTGYLKNSIQMDLSRLSELVGEVAVGAEYAVYVEFGTSRMVAQPYMTPAAEDVGASLVEVVQRLINSKIGD